MLGVVDDWNRIFNLDLLYRPLDLSAHDVYAAVVGSLQSSGGVDEESEVNGGRCDRCI